MASLQKSFYTSICFFLTIFLLWMQALKSSDISAVIYFSFALTNITCGPRDFLWPLPTSIFTQFFRIQRYFIKVHKIVLQTQSHHGEDIEYYCHFVLYSMEVNAAFFWHCNHLFHAGYSPFCIIKIVFFFPEK